ncbi:DNA cytosine methyltransferase [Nocardioides dongxiaopingii]|uniref:DNA cytosine methyltransferase n=1 Tax=Nocardioides dongxiaopingii TaxID=2576036 RepID=UPI0010C76626
MFSGAGGLDLGFEEAGFQHLGAMDWDPWSVATMRYNRPDWCVDEADAREWEFSGPADVLIAGPPCQGYSLGGNRKAGDERNDLYEQVLRVAKESQPRVIVIENVLNLRTIVHPVTGRAFDKQIEFDLTSLGYEVHRAVFRMDGFGVPQTRRRWLFVAFRGRGPQGYHLPVADESESVRKWIWDLGQGGGSGLPNHDPKWGFKSRVHVETGEQFDPAEPAVIARFSRTASDGNPIRSFDTPFPAVDTATIWGWAQGNVRAERVLPDRTTAKGVRNRASKVPLWRIEASRLRAMTHRELARLQTFPDDWTFVGGTASRSVHMQVGNAVPVEFARRLGANVSRALACLDKGERFAPEREQQLVLPGFAGTVPLIA